MPVNQAPRIDPDTLSPAPFEGSVRMWRDCPRGYEHRAVLRDPDAADTIYWRVFLDYNANRDQEPTEGLATTTEPALIVFVADPSSFAGAGAQHFVELLVSDRPFFAPFGRVVADDALTDAVQWTVELTTDPDTRCLQ